MYPTPMALSRTPFARDMFSGMCLVMRQRHVTLTNASPIPMTSRESAHTDVMRRVAAGSQGGRASEAPPSTAHAS